jgi:hypothetical protein
VIVHEHGRADVHRRDEDETFLYTADLDLCGDRIGDVDDLLPLAGVEPEIVSM